MGPGGKICRLVALVGIDGSPQSPGGLFQIDGLIMAGLVQ
jgi:hypothetical protein